MKWLPNFSICIFSVPDKLYDTLITLSLSGLKLNENLFRQMIGLVVWIIWNRNGLLRLRNNQNPLDIVVGSDMCVDVVVLGISSVRR